METVHLQRFWYNSVYCHKFQPHSLWEEECQWLLGGCGVYMAVGSEITTRVDRNCNRKAVVCSGILRQLGAAEDFPGVNRWSKFMAGTHVRVPWGTKAAYLARGGCPQPLNPTPSTPNPKPRTSKTRNINRTPLKPET